MEIEVINRLKRKYHFDMTPTLTKKRQKDPVIMRFIYA